MTSGLSMQRVCFTRPVTESAVVDIPMPDEATELERLELADEWLRENGQASLTWERDEGNLVKNGNVEVHLEDS